jgi:hypothetical protein
LSPDNGIKNVFVKFKDTAGNESVVVSDSITLVVDSVTPGNEIPIDVTEDAAELTRILGIEQHPNWETDNISRVVAIAQQTGVVLHNSDLTKAVNFVTYGISDVTIRLGWVERLTLVRDQLETLGYININVLTEIASGKKPSKRNILHEQRQYVAASQAFRALVGRNYNPTDLTDDLAWHTMMYRLRFPRNIVKENAAVAQYVKVFKRKPVSAFDWSVVRAWAYVLSGRGQTIVKETGNTLIIKSTPTGWLRVRSAPSLTGAIIGSVYPNQRYAFSQEKNGWFNITISGSQKGWVSGQYIAVVSKATPEKINIPEPKKIIVPKAKTITVQATPTGWLNVRSIPSTQGTIKTRVYPSQSYVYTKYEQGWYLITLNNGTTGWVTEQYVK